MTTGCGHGGVSVGVSGDVSKQGCRVGVSQQFIPLPQELGLIVKMREQLFLRA